MEFLHSFLRCHFTGKPVLASLNVGCFLRLGIMRIAFFEPLDLTILWVGGGRVGWGGGSRGGSPASKTALKEYSPNLTITVTFYTLHSYLLHLIESPDVAEQSVHSLSVTTKNTVG